MTKRGLLPIFAGISFLLGLITVLLFILIQQPPAETSQVPTPTTAQLALPPTSIPPAPTEKSAETNMVIVVATPSTTPTDQPTSQPTDQPPITHVVQAGDTLIGIALSYGATVADLITANNLTNADALFVGQNIVVPFVAPPEISNLITTPNPDKATPIAATTTQPTWLPSLISGDLQANYPLSAVVENGTVIVHYQPNTYVARNLETWVKHSETIWSEAQASIGGRVDQPIHVYYAGTLFAINPALQGFTQSGLYHSFILLNEGFTTGEQKYIVAHELTHIAATQILGSGSSVLLHEGLATYLAQKYLVGEAGYLPHTEICALAYQTPAFRTATEMSNFGYGANVFGGHLRTFVHYNLSACFVGFLIETYGMAQFERVYVNGDYAGIYAQTLSQLDSQWQTQLATNTPTLNPRAFVTQINAVAQAYTAYTTASTDGNHANWEAYLQLNKARTAINQGNIALSHTALNSFSELFDAP
jgi:LysM repeat protein